MITFRQLKLLLVACSMSLIAVSSYAGQKSIVIVDQVVPSDTAFIDVNFNFDKNTGHAWIEYATSWNDEVDSGLRSHVPGLSYSEASHEIVYNAGAGRIVCANVRGASWTSPLGETIEPTGRCNLKGQIQVRRQDDGYEGEDVSYVHIEMDIN